MQGGVRSFLLALMISGMLRSHWFPSLRLQRGQGVIDRGSEEGRTSPRISRARHNAALCDTFRDHAQRDTLPSRQLTALSHPSAPPRTIRALQTQTNPPPAPGPASPSAHCPKMSRQKPATQTPPPHHPTTPPRFRPQRISRPPTGIHPKRPIQPSKRHCLRPALRMDLTRRPRSSRECICLAPHSTQEATDG